MKRQVEESTYRWDRGGAAGTGLHFAFGTGWNGRWSLPPHVQPGATCHPSEGGEFSCSAKTPAFATHPPGSVSLAPALVLGYLTSFVAVWEFTVRSFSVHRASCVRKSLRAVTAILMVCAVVSCASGDGVGGGGVAAGADASSAEDSPVGSGNRVGDSGSDFGPVGIVPHAVKVARATAIPSCTVFVDAAHPGVADGSRISPFTSITAAVAAATDGAVICVAHGTYAEQLTPGTKAFTLAGGFQRGTGFTIRDSSLYPSTATGDGTGSFLRIDDPGPTGEALTAIDGFEVTGYSQAIVRDVYYSQRFDLTNNYIHDNTCDRDGLNGAGFSLNNVSGTIMGNVIARNSCWRGGAGAINDTTNSNAVVVLGNWIDANLGNEPDISHGGGLYLFANDLVISGNLFTGNEVTGWGGGLFLGAFSGGGQFTTAHLSWNIYRENRAGYYGGGFFCDDSAHCFSSHELYDSNCGGNVFLDSGSGGADATVATFDHMTNHGAREVGCGAPGAGVQITKGNDANDSYTFTNSIFWGNAVERDFEASCEVSCAAVTVNVTYSNVQETYLNGGIDIAFGPGNLPSLDPLFVDPEAGDFHLQSTAGHWTPSGYVTDAADSPALSAGDPAGPVADNPPGVGTRSELGMYGNSAEASLESVKK